MKEVDCYFIVCAPYVSIKSQCLNLVTGRPWKDIILMLINPLKGILKHYQERVTAVQDAPGPVKLF